MIQTSQDQGFTAFEGDRWFERNQLALERFDPKTDLPLRVMQLYDLQPRSVLEVGAANGLRLAAIAQRHGARVLGVEPSEAAIRDGRRRFPAVEFVQGVANGIDVQEQFDLVIVSFVLHWIDRTSLLHSVAELDRVLADGGFLIISDFLPSNRTRVRYHHLPDREVYTYKQDYAAILLGTGSYQTICMLTADHGPKALDAWTSDEDRIGAWLLQKRLDENYIEASLTRARAEARHPETSR